MVKSIFDLEVRLDFDKEYKRIMEIIDSPIFSTSYQSGFSFYEIINSIFQFWPYRRTARTIDEYFELKDLRFGDFSSSKEEKLYDLQFVFDFIFWIYNPNREMSEMYDSIRIESIIRNCLENNRHHFVLITDNIEEIIESLNMEIQTINDHITFIKRDADVDSVLTQLEEEPNIRLLLLSYNDFRIENSLNDKKQIVRKLADWLEPQRNKYKSINSNLTKDIFNAINNGNIRHNTPNQWHFENDEEQIKMYDKIFKMILHLIREEDVKIISAEIKELSSQKH